MGRYHLLVHVVVRFISYGTDSLDWFCTRCSATPNTNTAWSIQADDVMFVRRVCRRSTVQSSAFHTTAASFHLDGVVVTSNTLLISDSSLNLTVTGSSMCTFLETTAAKCVVCAVTAMAIPTTTWQHQQELMSVISQMVRTSSVTVGSFTTPSNLTNRMYRLHIVAWLNW